MSLGDKPKDFAATMRRLSSHWRFAAALAAVVAMGGVYLERKLFPTAPPTVFAANETTAPSAPAAPGQAPARGADKGETQTGAPAETPADMSSQFVEIAARPVAILRGQGNWTDGSKTLAEAIAKVSAAMTRAGLVAAGRPLAAFTETTDAGFHFEAMIPIAKAPEGKGELGEGVEIGASPSGKALKFQHRGAYEEIDATYEAITAYLDEKGLDTRNLFIEEYLTDLKAGDDASLEVDVYVFVK